MPKNKRWLAKAILYLILELGALSGVPVRPDEIEAIMNQSKASEVLVVRSDEGDGDGDGLFGHPSRNS
ncbi:MAG: hypothetical protein QOH21_3816 [Acidobacteriota bacterium]|nr:hypothetical protein [Acidobacteriota bacterium]